MSHSMAEIDIPAPFVVTRHSQNYRVLVAVGSGETVMNGFIIPDWVMGYTDDLTGRVKRNLRWARHVPSEMRTAKVLDSTHPDLLPGDNVLVDYAAECDEFNRVDFPELPEGVVVRLYSDPEHDIVKC